MLGWARQPPSCGWEPPGPTINISSSGGHPPAVSESVQSLWGEGGGTPAWLLWSHWAGESSRGRQAVFRENG